MRMLTDVSRGQWLIDRAGKWATVSGVAGTGFEAYARILHPIPVSRWDEENRRISEETTWSWKQVAERLGRRLHSRTEWMELTDGESLLNRPDADGWRIGQSLEGWFDPELLARLTVHLREATATPDDLTLAFWEGFAQFSGAVTYLTLTGDDGGAGRRDALARLSPEFREIYDSRIRMHYPGRDFLLAGSDLDELSDPAWPYAAGIGWSGGRFPGPSPQLIWPADHAWVVASEIDWDFTILAGPRELIDAVLADPVFEVFRAYPNRHPTEPR